MTEIADGGRACPGPGSTRTFPDKASLIVAALAQTDEAFWADAHARVSRC